MNSLTAVIWIQNQPGLKLMVNKDLSITITNGVTIEATASCITEAVEKYVEIYRTKRGPDVSCTFK